ncbi:hypothetical protein POJ06DRAFT_260928 [Lipomyces tetrasporus]|uniref:DUF4185 domain-containing protein n=1 Tax=Lipomyces tetrasporus TaxID=54092 RepID=A0AAD7QLC7_9ASCO|nr:uncharacterized protein POJ06DRAFT_260928 [Lipomyces tetrasporus]KAJ8097259.1 hypothetical protein POJ06DRAFT_260928 [Lipomyces tetrasporus]
MVHPKNILLVTISLSKALATPIVKRDTPSAVASVSYALPSLLTPVRQAPSPSYGVTPNNTDFEIESFEEFGKQEDPDNPLTIYRDGGGSCSIGNRTIWFFCDTSGYQNDTFKAITDNSLSVARTFDEPSLLTDATSNSLYSYGWNPAVPYTAEEYPWRNRPSKRYVMWTYTNCLQVSENRAVQYFHLYKYNSLSSTSDWGNTMATLDFDPDTEMLTVTRDKQVTFPNTTYEYGSFANMVVDGVAFLYALDTKYSSKKDVHVARVATDSLSQYDTYQYYDASTKTWSYNQPQPTARRQSAAVMSNYMPYSTGSMFYSEYHNAYLLVYFSNWADSTFRVSYAPSPVGPWTTDDKVLYTVPQGPGGYDYGGVAHPQYYQDGPSGKALLVHYSYRDTSYTYTKAAKLVFK